MRYDLSLIASWIEPGATVLDLGCGAGDLLHILSVDKNVPKHKQADLIIKNPDYAGHMKDLFNTYWEKALKIEDYKKEKN